MDILLYRDDGLGDALFTIPTLKIILDNLKEGDRLFFASPYSLWIKSLIQDDKLIPICVKRIDIEKYLGKEFDIALFLGPWGKIKNISHLKIISKIKAKYKFISSYRAKLFFNFLKSFYAIFPLEISSALGISFGRIFFIDFEEIFEGHDIINTFNFVSKAFEIVNFSWFVKFKDKVFLLYDYEKFLNGSFSDENFPNRSLQRREKKLIVHFTYKSFGFGFGLDDYRILLDDLRRFWKGEIVFVFGPYEKKYFDLMEGVVKKAVITNLNDYVELCLQSFGMIGFDTGPVHLAAFFNVPLVVSVFPDEGFENRVKRWNPYSNRSKVFVFRYSEIKKGVENTPLLSFLDF